MYLFETLCNNSHTIIECLCVFEEDLTRYIHLSKLFIQFFFSSSYVPTAQFHRGFLFCSVFKYFLLYSTSTKFKNVTKIMILCNYWILECVRLHGVFFFESKTLIDLLTCDPGWNFQYVLLRYVLRVVVVIVVVNLAVLNPQCLRLGILVLLSVF